MFWNCFLHKPRERLELTPRGKIWGHAGGEGTAKKKEGPQLW